MSASIVCNHLSIHRQRLVVVAMVGVWMCTERPKALEPMGPIGPMEPMGSWAPGAHRALEPMGPIGPSGPWSQWGPGAL